MDQAPMVEMIDDGQKLIDALTQDGIEVTIAFWAKADDDERWYLYLVLPMLLSEGVSTAYRRIHPVVRQLQAQTFWIHPLEIKLLSPQSPMADAAAKLRGSYPGITRSAGPRLGDASVDGAIIYPPVRKPIAR